MRITIGENTYNLKFRTEELAPSLEKFPENIASKTLSELSSKEIQSVMGRMKRNIRKMAIRKGTTTVSLFTANQDGSESLIATLTVANHKNDQFDPARGRREAWEKMRATLVGFDKADLRAMTNAFYDRYPKSRPHYT